MHSDRPENQHQTASARRLLITGATGLLGTDLCRLASDHWEVYGTYRHRPLNISNIRSEYLDITDFSALKQCFSKIKPHAVIHAAAESNAHTCQTRPADTSKVNIGASSNIAGLCADMDIPCVFTSSDLVFDGLASPYSEDAAPTPACAYGEQKAKAEQGMRGRFPATTVCRLPLLIGHVSGLKRFFAWMVRRIHRGLPVSLFVDEFRTPVDTASAAAGLLMAVRMPASVLHLGGRTRISRYDIGRWVERILRIDRTCINPVLLMDADMTAPRPPDVTLVSELAYKAGYAPLDLGRGLERQVSAVIDEPDPVPDPVPPL